MDDEDFSDSPELADMIARAPQSWLEALEESRLDEEAGRIVPMEEVIANLWALLAEMRANKAARQIAAE